MECTLPYVVRAKAVVLSSLALCKEVLPESETTQEVTNEASLWSDVGLKQSSGLSIIKTNLSLDL